MLKVARNEEPCWTVCLHDCRGIWHFLWSKTNEMWFITVTSHRELLDVLHIWVNCLISHTAKTETCCLSIIVYKGPFKQSSLASWELISTMFLLLPLFLDWSWSLLGENGQTFNHRPGGSPRNKSNVATLKDEKFLCILWSDFRVSSSVNAPSYCESTQIWYH